MTKLIVDEVGDPKEVPAGTSKAGKAYSAFKSYSFKSGSQWYQWRGKGGDSLMVGQPVHGNIERKTFTKKDGSQGTACNFTPISQETAELLNRVEVLEKAVFAKEEPEPGDEPPHTDEENKEEIDIDDIPF